MLSQGTPSLCKGFTSPQKINHYITVIACYFCKHILFLGEIDVNIACDKLPKPSLSSRLRVYFFIHPDGTRSVLKSGRNICHTLT